MAQTLTVARLDLPPTQAWTLILGAARGMQRRSNRAFLADRF